MNGASIERARLHAEMRRHEQVLRDEFQALSETAHALSAPVLAPRTLTAALPYLAMAALGVVILRRARRKALLTRVLVPAAIEVWRALSIAQRDRTRHALHTAYDEE